MPNPRPEIETGDPNIAEAAGWVDCSQSRAVAAIGQLANARIEFPLAAPNAAGIEAQGR